jgi:hypothetical protein
MRNDTADPRRHETHSTPGLRPESLPGPCPRDTDSDIVLFSKVREKYNTRFQNLFSESGLFYVFRIGLVFRFFCGTKNYNIGLGKSCRNAE